MNWFFWKKKATGEVISHQDYNKIPHEHRHQFDAVADTQATHTIKKREDGDEGDSFGNTILTAMVVNELLSDHDKPSTDTGSDTGGTNSNGPEFGGYNGGSGGGSGAGGSFYNAPADPVQSQPDDGVRYPDTSSQSDTGSNDSDSFQSSGTSDGTLSGSESSSSDSGSDSSSSYESSSDSGSSSDSSYDSGSSDSGSSDSSS